MRYRVLFAGRQAEDVDSAFPGLAVRMVAERLGLDRDTDCAVVDSIDGSLSHWRVSKLEAWYVRPIEEAGGA